MTAYRCVVSCRDVGGNPDLVPVTIKHDGERGTTIQLRNEVVDYLKGHGYHQFGSVYDAKNFYNWRIFDALDWEGADRDSEVMASDG